MNIDNSKLLKLYSSLPTASKNKEIDLLIQEIDSLIGNIYNLKGIKYSGVVKQKSMDNITNLYENLWNVKNQLIMLNYILNKK